MGNKIQGYAEGGRMKKTTQHSIILYYLQQGAKLTALDALDLCGTMKLSSRVGELKEQGHNIKDSWLKVDSGKKVKIYWLEGK